ncbi:putative phospholipid-binding protein [Mycoplasmoides gallisepticum str. R(low)]|uniref:Phospholipid-binding protein n=1 Tax=Mycoplasmoides gallisepticum (strain R(low / passage 15 / clone 2)) TaxID=710127 RepID=Q7NB45_MYCGA|nr:YbhB/YbcL family Raf kinase inhibitor-like protein [Mycoplasmoides gallisepticum]AAP56785.2 putative phospholipid-binding protein [Mycoplasmoides gallisepticum str. R(low)]ADC30642.1 putative phospholipid-binding protein [Mycoplasmoides gallisepticum str. R(high)]
MRWIINMDMKKKHAIWSNCFTETGDGVYLKSETVKLNNNRYESLDLTWDKIEGAKSYAVVMVDYEASRVIGQSFIHWVVANVKENKLAYAANINNKSIVQGLNSTAQGQTESSKGVIIECVPGAFKNTAEAASDYLPPLPPDDTHLYTLRVYGLDVDHVDLPKHFSLTDLNQKIIRHTVGEHELHFWYKPN